MKKSASKTTPKREVMNNAEDLTLCARIALKKAHDEDGMTHAQIAEKLGVSRRSIGHFLNEARTLPDDVLKRALVEFSIREPAQATSAKTIDRLKSQKAGKAAKKLAEIAEVVEAPAQAQSQRAAQPKAVSAVKTLRDLKLSDAIMDRVTTLADITPAASIETALIGLLAAYDSIANQTASLLALTAKKELRKKPVAENEHGRGFYGVIHKDGLFCGFPYDLKKSESGHILIRVRPGVSIGFPYVQQSFTKVDLPYGDDQKSAECAVLKCLAKGDSDASSQISALFMRARADYTATVSGIKRLGHLSVLLSDWRDMMRYVGPAGEDFAKPVIDRIRCVMVRLTSPK